MTALYALLQSVMYLRQHRHVIVQIHSIF